MSVLVLQHFEEYWREGLANNGTDFETECQKVLDFILHQEDLTEVIVTRFEHDDFGNEHGNLIELCESKGIRATCHEYGYAWSKEGYANDLENSPYAENNFNKTWCQGTRDYHGEDDVIEIAEWMLPLKREKVYLGGAFEGECIADIEAAFNAIDIDYEEVDGLIVGSGCPYIWKGNNPSDLSEKISQFLGGIQESFEERCDELDCPEELDVLDTADPRFALNLRNDIRRFYIENSEDIKSYHLDFYCHHEKLQEFIEAEIIDGMELELEKDDIEDKEVVISITAKKNKIKP